MRVHWPLFVAAATLLMTVARVALGEQAASAGKPGKDLVVAPTPASEDAAPPARWAVLVGVGNYDDDSIPALHYSCSDVRALREVLVDPKRGGFAEANVVSLTDDATDPKLKPTRLNVLARLRSWAGIAGPNDTLLFFYSGHGIAEKGKGYLIPSDARIGILSDSAVPSARVDEILAESKAKSTLMILDACHSAAGKDLAVMSTALSQELFSDADGRVTMASCEENQQSFEWKEKGQSVYTHFLVEGLRGGADANGDGAITVTELNTYAHGKVTRWAAENGRQQKPRARMNISGDIVLTQAPPASSPTPGTAPAITPILLPAKLQVESKPSGARVLLDGKEAGRTGCEVVIGSVTGKPRKYQVVVEKPGYRSQGLELDLAGGEVVPLDVELEKVSGPTGSGTGTAAAPGQTVSPTGAGPSSGNTAAAPSSTAGGEGTAAGGVPDGRAPQSGQLAAKRIADAIAALASGPPKFRLTPGQRAQLARILEPFRGRETITLAEAQALKARVRPILREEQRMALARLLQPSARPRIQGSENRRKPLGAEGGVRPADPSDRPDATPGAKRPPVKKPLRRR